MPLEENDDDDEAGATEAFHDLGRPQFESPDGENQQFPSRSDSFQVDRAHSSRTGPLGTVDTVQDQMAEAEQLAKEVRGPASWRSSCPSWNRKRFRPRRTEDMKNYDE